MDAGKQDERTELILVGFNQQQRQLIEKLRAESAFAKFTDGQIIQFGFTNWLRNEGRLPPK
jgi:hypothetical protein